MTELLHTEEMFDTGLTASANGLYALRLSFNGQVFVLEESFLSGEALVFDLERLNEDYTYTCIGIEFPNGTVQKIDAIRIKIAL
jgi:hypothetical protein